MHHDFLDRYSRLDSPVHRQSAGLKLALALTAVIGVALLPPARFVMLAPIALALLTVAILARLPLGLVIRRVLLLEPFVLSVALLALVRPGGWRLFLFLLAKSTVCLLAMVLLASTTPFAALLRTLKAVHVPTLLVTTLALLYRYLFVLVDEAGRMKRARASRTFSPRQRLAWQNAAAVVSQLFIRSSERAERIYAAMTARGWQ